MKTVPLYGKVAAGRVALVDDEDYELVMQYRWNGRDTVSGGLYAVTRKRGSGSKIFMHRMLTGFPGADHRDLNGLNNQRANLRVSSHAQNQANKLKRKDSASPYKGVTRHDGRWSAQVQLNYEIRNLGRFIDEIDAALAYDAGARALHGEFARLNFPALSAGESSAALGQRRLDTPATSREGAYTPDRLGTSRFKGVSWNSRSKRWLAAIEANGKRLRLGLYVSEMAAGLAYDDAAAGLHGDRAVLNFPEGVPREIREQLQAEQEVAAAEIFTEGRRKHALAMAEWWEGVEPTRRTCTVCHREFHSRWLNGAPLYCGTSCADEARRRRDREKKERPEPDPGTPGVRACAVCGRRYSPGTARALYCGVQCKDAAFRQRMRDAARTRELEGRLF